MIPLCSISIGVVIGVIDALFFMNFDSTWKKIFTVLFGLGGSGGLIPLSFEWFIIEKSQERMLFVSCLIFSFIFSFILALFIASLLIKDKNDDIKIRFGDILLGQQEYIKKYYDKRIHQIDNQLNIPLLDQREKELEKRERICSESEKQIQEEQKKIQLWGKDKITFILPALPTNKRIVISQRFINQIPGFVSELKFLYSRIKNATDSLLEKNNILLVDLKGFFCEISTYIMDYLFAEEEVRVHFRKYAFENEKYEMICAITGRDKKPEASLTPIPFNNSMIQRSYDCRRGVLRSLNLEADFPGVHYTKWKEYLTITFGNITKDNMPILSMGISVQNKEKYEDIFYFLGFINFDIFINDRIEDINRKFSLEKKLY